MTQQQAVSVIILKNYKHLVSIKNKQYFVLGKKGVHEKIRESITIGKLMKIRLYYIILKK